MKVLQVNGSDTGGSGGQIAMLRLQEGLHRTGVESRILCIEKTREDSVRIPRINRLERRTTALTARFGLNDIGNIGTFRIPSLPAYSEADLLHIHWLYDCGINFLALPRLTKKKPAVMTLHDMWSFTGHCSYSFDCNRWLNGCGKCPYPNSYPAVRRDATALEWKLKKFVYGRSNLTIIAPSSWMASLARQSILSRFPIHHIPNGVDTEVYSPLDRGTCRAALGIPVGKKVILFMAMRVDPADKEVGHRKGADLLLAALNQLPEDLKHRTVLLVLGEGGEALIRKTGFEGISLEYVKSDRLKRIAYSAADLLIFPSRAENLSLVLLESMACGTPVVSFRVGGVPDLVRPGVTGYLAEPEDVKGLVSGIEKLLNDAPLRLALGKQCREIAVKEYAFPTYLERHIELYRKVVRT